jgi:hypothetical protein
VTVDVPASGSILTRGLGVVPSSGSSFVTDGVDIAKLAGDLFLFTGVDASLDITLSGIAAGSYDFEGWWSDNFQSPGVVNQKLEYSTDGGTNFTLVNGSVDAGGINASPESFLFVSDGLQDVVVRVTESNTFNQLRLSGFAVEVVAVPEPSTALLVGLGMLGLSVYRRFGTA